MDGNEVEKELFMRIIFRVKHQVGNVVENHVAAVMLKLKINSFPSFRLQADI